MSAKKNHLHNATSPYLLQHADNPVHWWPWCEQALDQARSENKPILLSIGYSACHWCHVMAHESFEDPETAALMNRLFINIKVDREERPDLDMLYQSSHQLLAQNPGGWPLTVFLTPNDQAPFFTGTYFPKTSRHGLPAFKEILQWIEQAYRDQADAIARQNVSLTDALASLDPQPANQAIQIDDQPITIAYQQLRQQFDRHRGGFGGAPKFPHPTNLEFLIRHWANTAHKENPNQQALQMSVFTLQRMALGGLFDQLGGGFYRYSVDDRWEIPHFEKMLYDNGQLLGLYADAWQITGADLFYRTAVATADWVIREMQSPDGGYYSSLDADSEGEEGLFYIWTQQQVASQLDPEEMRIAIMAYGMDAPANFEGKWHLKLAKDIPVLARELNLEPDIIARQLGSIRHKLFKARESRIHPGLDDKVLTAWNALMIKGMVRTAYRLDRTDYLESAEQALDFLRRTQWKKGRLLATYRNGEARLPAYLDDHAYLLDALIETLQLRWRSDYLEWAIQLADTLLARFIDPRLGGFFFVADDHEKLIHRAKTLTDDATPSGNGIAAHALQRLGFILGEPRYLDAADQVLRLAWQSMSRYPHAHGSLLWMLEDQLAPLETLILRGEENELKCWRDTTDQHYYPTRMILSIPHNAPELPPNLAAKTSHDQIVAYLCQGTQCSEPIAEIKQLVTLLNNP